MATGHKRITKVVRNGYVNSVIRWVLMDIHTKEKLSPIVSGRCLGEAQEKLREMGFDV